MFVKRNTSQVYFHSVGIDLLQVASAEMAAVTRNKAATSSMTKTRTARIAAGR
ncbi:MAG: hypothetical protein RR131_10040 [Anaerovorax sp.]